MEVLVMIGSYAGQIRDVKPLYARGMIERGEAVDPNMPLSEGGEVVASPAVVGKQARETILPTALAAKLLAKAKKRKR